MLVRFWGVRGSAPWSGESSVAYGRNTPCIEVRDETTNALLIIDAGTGLAGLGRTLLDARPGSVSILLSHYHPAHVQGLPFFSPFSRPDWAPVIWAPSLGQDGRARVEQLFAQPNVPFAMSLPKINVVEAGELEIGGFHVRALQLNHPGGAFAYRIRGAANDLVYMTDHEFGNEEIDEQLAPFAVNSGATVCDAHFTPDELPAFAGHGHGTWHQGTEFASATGAGYLWLFHHRPGRTDAELDAIEARARRVYPATRVAREGDAFSL